MYYSSSILSRSSSQLLCGLHYLLLSVPLIKLTATIATFTSADVLECAANAAAIAVLTAVLTAAARARGGETHTLGGVRGGRCDYGEVMRW